MGAFYKGFVICSVFIYLIAFALLAISYPYSYTYLEHKNKIHVIDFLLKKKLYDFQKIMCSK